MTDGTIESAAFSAPNIQSRPKLERIDLFVAGKTAKARLRNSRFRLKAKIPIME
jgi:hypothetical protein